MEKFSNITDSGGVGGLQLKEAAFCVKTHQENDGGSKFFINFCHSTSVSPPTLQLDEVELQKLIDNDDFEELTKFTIPLVLECIEQTTDKKGQTAKLTHAIVNSNFYHRQVKQSDVYKRFLVFVTMEIINEKFQLQLNQTDYVILKNKQFQLSDNRSCFSKFILPYIPANNNNNVQQQQQQSSTKNTSVISSVISSNDTNSSSKSMITLIDESTTTPSTTTTTSSSNDNVRIGLDLKQNLVNIIIELPSSSTDNNEQQQQQSMLENLQLMLNEDHIVVKHNNVVLNDFYLTITLLVDQASAILRNNILRIKCPVLL